MTHEEYIENCTIELCENAQRYLNGTLDFIGALRAMFEMIITLEGRESEIAVSLVCFESETDHLPSASQFHLWDEMALDSKKAAILHAEGSYGSEFGELCREIIAKYSR